MEDRKENFGVSRQAEERYLKKTLETVRANVENYGKEVARMQDDIDEMLAHYHDNDVEVLTILNNTVTLHEHMKRALMRNEKARNKPYFGRIIFCDEKTGKEESLYIGRGGIAKDATHQAVVDWRAPVANAYYENSLGKCSYTAPDGIEIKIDLNLKRTYEIEKGKLLDYYDSEVIANDDLLTKYLARNKQAVLGEIVATIQREQNEIIRKSPYHNVIVQGVAGSGKTTVAMHRISYILYNYSERFRPEDFYIVGSNRILLNYITGVLPDLDVYGVRQMTMEQLFVRLLYEDWDEKKYKIKGTEKGSIRGSSRWFGDLEEYCRKLEWESISRETVYLNPGQFVEGFRNGKTGVFDGTGGEKTEEKNLVCLLSGEAVEDYIRKNPSVSVQNKIDMLNERLLGKVKDEFLGKGITYSEAEKKAILKTYRGWYGGRNWKYSIFDMYRDFLREQLAGGYETEIPENEFDVYDLAALAYLYKRVKEKEVISEASHVVIDEAQDFGMMAYHALKFCINRCTYTVMGDVSQNIYFGSGLNDWEELREVLLADGMDSFCILKKSYRNTVEISDFATGILRHGQFSIYPVEPIIRHGKPVRVRKLPDRKSLIREAAALCESWQEKGLGAIAVVCRNGETAKRAAKELAAYVEIMESDPERAEFGNGIMVLSVAYTKGLEFDAVLILDPTRQEYPADDGHAKLLYVAATRALHELQVFYEGDLTGLIADPLPEREERKGTLKKNISVARGISQKSNMSAEKEKTPENRWEKGRENSDPAAGEGQKPPVAVPKIPGRKRPAAVLAKAVTPEEKRPFISRQTGIKPPGMDADRRQEGTRRKENVREPRFGDMPATDALRPPGHGKIDLATRWFTRKADGLYFQSRYGTLRIGVIDSEIIRVTFAKGPEISEGICPGITMRKTENAWMYREAGGMVELTTDELCLRINKGSGAISYMTQEKKLLLSERDREPRQLEEGTGGRVKCWLYLDWKKKENLYAPGTGGKNGINLTGSARYISYGKEENRLPVLISDLGYAIIPAADTAICCNIPAYGNYLYMEGRRQMDYYVIGGKGQKKVEDACKRLLGYGGDNADGKK